STLAFVPYTLDTEVGGKSLNPFRQSFVILSIFVLALALTVSADAQNLAVTTAGVNFRATANNGPTLGTIPAGSSLEHLGYEGNWLRIKYGNRTGYVYNDYIRSTTPVAPGVAISRVNFRATANGKKLGVIPSNARFEVLDTQGDWLRVKYNGRIGY